MSAPPERIRCTPLLLAALALLAGCALPPAALRGGPFAALDPAQAAKGATTTDPVRWGGIIAETRPGAERTCFLVVGLPLDEVARPERADQPGARFLACAQGFFEPEVYAPERLLTVVGYLSGTSREKVGGYDYDAAVVDAYSVYLWPRIPEYERAWGAWPYWYGAPGLWIYGGPGFGGWGPWPYPYYGRPWMW